jgi:peroxiredoxin (alkyl hydroperoxide reductase subunit C)
VLAVNKYFKIQIVLLAVMLFVSSHAFGRSEAFKNNIYNPGILKPIDSVLKIKVGEKVPDFALPSLSGQKISLSQFRGKKNVAISFVPAAWTPVCSDQWPGYNIAEPFFQQNDAILLGITVDNLPTLFAWTNQMGNLWFPVLSDFYPHGKVAETFGVLRSDGVSERALFVIDKEGILRYAHVGDINKRPDLQTLVTELEKLNGK